jgi:hypothetical protein
MLKRIDSWGAIHWHITVRRDDEKRESTRRCELYSEADYLHRCFFGEPADEMLLDRYARAHDRYGIEGGQDLWLMKMVMTHYLDAEAVEYVLWLKNRNNLLTRKVEILHFLAECQPRHSTVFFNDKDKGLNAWLDIMRVLTDTLRYLVVGRKLVRRYGLA